MTKYSVIQSQMQQACFESGSSSRACNLMWLPHYASILFGSQSEYIRGCVHLGHAFERLVSSSQMEAQYSPDVIAAAGSLQTYTYMYASMVTFWTYDYACSLDDEWTFLLRSRWTKVKSLYIITRYVPFIFFIGHLYLNFIPNDNPNECQTLNSVYEGISLVSVICSECFFIIRTYALWNSSKIILAVILFSFFAIIIASVSVLFATTVTAPFETSGIPGITGCYQSEGSVELFIPFLLLFALEFELLLLSLIRAIQSWRTASNALYVVLLRHNVFYYACGLLNIFTSLFLKYAYSYLLQNFQVIILALLATRMHLHLWHADRRIRGSDGLVLIPLSDISSAGRPA
ncbi:hypothetical protein K503DRAFT_867382 [Rhizopogon vinicolor AM-OR11-026]|uniref:DUF6533 domain-containing protein n=1 Tax=Rhizopogon vinicolor AM-OR11-026 TaxID=1314800 RepID=A0A1B7MVV1_9AGAM|nr:hypothetical protein K503DRAFT_867382 [Rhizopogon vinicolor AM-OR11-026]